jgi:hypothetical protein
VKLFSPEALKRRALQGRFEAGKVVHEVIVLVTASPLNVPELKVVLELREDRILREFSNSRLDLRPSGNTAVLDGSQEELAMSLIL